jgi:ribosome-binding factor A
MRRVGQSARAGAPRHLRVGEGLRRALSDVFARGSLRDPDLQGATITVSEVRMSPDLRHATVFVVPLGGDRIAEVEAALSRSAPYLRGEVAKLVRLRYMPNLSFQIDQSFDAATRIDGLLRDLDIPEDDADGA